MNWTELSKLPVGTFQPMPQYDVDADTLTFFIRDSESYRERVDSILTVYRSMATNEVVGCHVKGVSRILRAVQAFRLGIQSRRVKINLILVGIPWIERPDEGRAFTREYLEIVRPIVESAGDAEIELPDDVGLVSTPNS